MYNARLFDYFLISIFMIWIILCGNMLGWSGFSGVLGWNIPSMKNNSWCDSFHCAFMSVFLARPSFVAGRNWLEQDIGGETWSSEWNVIWADWNCPPDGNINKNKVESALIPREVILEALFSKKHQHILLHSRFATRQEVLRTLKAKHEPFTMTFIFKRVLCINFSWGTFLSWFPLSTTYEPD